MKQVVVIGGGISGLSAAYRLSKASQGNYQVALLEASDRLGGKILTERRQDCVFELGPDSFLTIKPDALNLIREIGLESQLLKTNPNRTDIFVYTRGRLRRLPKGLSLLAPTKMLPFLRSDLFTWKGKLRMAAEWLLPADGADDESLASFAKRRFGQEALSVLVQPIMAGIYAGDAEQLSVKSTFPRFIEMEKRYGSVIRGLRRSAIGQTPESAEVTMFMTLSGGLSELPKALARSLDSSIRTGATVRSISSDPSGYRLQLSVKDEIACDAIIMTTQAWQAADTVALMDPQLAKALQEIPFASSATLSLAYDAGDLLNLPQGFGFVVAQDELRQISAATFSSIKFPRRSDSGTSVVRCFLGGVGREEFLQESDERIIEIALLDLKRLLSVGARPKLAQLHRWEKANPQYIVGHDERLKRIDMRLKQHPGLWLAGASYRGVGIPDCIASGSQAAAEAHAYLAKL